MSTETWTPERVEQLRNHVATGLTCSQIAAEIGVTRNAVIGKIHRLGLAPGRPAGSRVQARRACGARGARTSVSSCAWRLRSALRRRRRASAAIESAQRCALLDLAHGQCRWPVGEPLSDARAADFVLRQRGDQGLLLLPGPRPPSLSGFGAAACLAIDRAAATPTSRCIAPNMPEIRLLPAGGRALSRRDFSCRRFEPRTPDNCLTDEGRNRNTSLQRRST